MGNFKDIEQKLQGFIRKYYSNQLIKGLILFIAFGLLYLLFTLFVEYFFWLPTGARTALFFVFLAVELALLIKFIAIPLSELMGLRKGISKDDSSKIIGKHFPTVDDKLLNILQLSEDDNKTELLLASIEQKSAKLRLVPFKKAVNFKHNVKYLKYLAFPLVIWLFTVLSGNTNLFNESLDRVVHYKTEYIPPAPFAFKILNEDLKVIEGQRYELEVMAEGSILPERVSIYFDQQRYLMKGDGKGQYSFTFSNLTAPIDFYVAANEVNSKEYRIEVLSTPRVINFNMRLNYPGYTGKRDETSKNTGNMVIPEGTIITWNIETKTTDSLHWISDEKFAFKQNDGNKFVLAKKIRKPLKYQITTSNRYLKDYEKLNYEIGLIKDEYPKIEVKTDIDSMQRGPVQFAGQLSDDYGIKKLNLVFYESGDEDNTTVIPVSLKKGTFQEFYYLFSPANDERIEPGKAYDLYFEVFDNDGINGSKSTKSQTFSYYQKTKEELTEELMKEQKESIDALSKTSKETDKLRKDFEEFSKKLKNKPELNWNDKKQFDQFLKRQEQYQNMLEQHTDKLKQNLEDQIEEKSEPSIEERKEELQKRIDEAKELQKKDRLLEELKKLSEKLDKENLMNKLEKLTEQNKQETRSLERILELTKRFYVERKASQIAMKLEELAKKQEELLKKTDEENNAKAQEKLNDEYEKLEKDFEELKHQNNNLAQPMDFPKTKLDRDVIKEAMQQAKEKLDEQQAVENKDVENQNQKEQAKTRQKLAAQKMKQLAQKMKGAMQDMQGESMKEDIATLRAILENLLNFSYDQEQLLTDLQGTSTNHAEYPKRLRKQQLLKQHFEHIDDSIYALALRQPKMSGKLQKDLTDAHYNINRSLANIAENRIQQGRSNQQYTMTAANNIADFLSDLLNSLQNPSMGSGQGKGKGKQGQGNGFQLPDIISKQKELGQKLKEGQQEGQKEGDKGKDGKEGKKGKNPGGNGLGGEQMSGEQYQIYQEQNKLRQELKELMDREGLGKNGNAGNQAKDVLKKMEELEQQLLDKGFTNDVLEQMRQMEHELLKLDTAIKEQGEDKKRESNRNIKSFEQRTIPPIRGKKLYFNMDEILNREPLPLKNNYKRKVQQYFRADGK